VVKQGEMIAVVTATGGNTFFGRTAKLVASAGTISHFQKAVLRIGNFLIVLAVAMAVVLVVDRLFHMHGNYDRNNLLRLAETVLIGYAEALGGDRAAEPSRHPPSWLTDCRRVGPACRRSFHKYRREES
jgi:magnesium-transporting ATPase (P-type)